ncbi:MAG: hypothetical protein KME26_26040 [Oscillatoria princeps RMCB-10]|nr:hypothetical protein [Oscillatoria princeps RMCB-10]
MPVSEQVESVPEARAWLVPVRWDISQVSASHRFCVGTRHVGSVHTGHGAWGMGHGAWGMGHGAWGMGHHRMIA